MSAACHNLEMNHDEDGEWGLHGLCAVCSGVRFDFAKLEHLESIARRTPAVSVSEMISQNAVETPCTPHHSIADDIVKSANLGCHLCSLIVACCRGQIEFNEGVDVLRDDTRVLPYMRTLMPNGLYLSVDRGINSLRLYPSLQDNHISEVIAELPLICDPKTDGPRQYYLFAPIASIRARLQQCLARHTVCQPHAKAYLPKRLLDISRGLDRLRLITVPLRISPRNTSLRKRLTTGYVTVSHRWQSDLQCKTTVSNIKQFHKHIPSHRVPQHFRDTIMLARKLDVQFLWIDSLCIIQEGDNGEDFHREALKMASIYERAYFNISIDVGDVSSGFLPINLREVRPCTLPAFAGLTPSLWVGPWPFIIPRTEPAVGKGGLEDRAWTLQERLLARRLIHCTLFGLIWECFEDHTGLEDKARQRQTLLNGSDLIAPTERRYDGLEFYRSHRNEACLWKFNAWYAVVEEFASRSITVPTDKLIAVSGLAARFDRTHIDLGQYIAGLWANDIAFGLGWFSPVNELPTCMNCAESHNLANDKEKIEAYRPLKGLGGYRAPSFSWASIEDNRQVIFQTPRLESERPRRDKDDEYQPALKSVFVETVQGDPFGLPVKGSLVLSGLCAQRHNFSKCAWIRGGNAPRLQYQLGETGRLLMDDIVYHRLERPTDLPKTAMIFLLATYPMIKGIVLLPLSNRDKRRKQRYRRIGLWAVMRSEEQKMYSHSSFDFSIWAEIVVTLV